MSFVGLLPYPSSVLFLALHIIFDLLGIDREFFQIPDRIGMRLLVFLDLFLLLRLQRFSVRCLVSE